MNQKSFSVFVINLLLIYHTPCAQVSKSLYKNDIFNISVKDVGTGGTPQNFAVNE